MMEMHWDGVKQNPFRPHHGVGRRPQTTNVECFHRVHNLHLIENKAHPPIIAMSIMESHSGRNWIFRLCEVTDYNPYVSGPIEEMAANL
jgi:hypothetical protein